MPGTLFLVGTPIGNLEDMSPRAIGVLHGAALIAAEDTRRTVKLLNRYRIKTPMRSYHQHNQKERLPELLAHLAAGDAVALVTDAGMPGISDPGEALVQAAAQAGCLVVPVPGPSACLLALAGSGLPTASFLFLGFLPRQAKPRRAALARLRDEPGTMVLYEAPSRLAKTLADLAEALGGDRKVVVARELTKIHEEFWRGDLAGALSRYSSSPVKGEVTLVVAGYGCRRRGETALADALGQVGAGVASGMTATDAIRQAAQMLGLPKNELYQAWITQGKDERQRKRRR